MELLSKGILFLLVAIYSPVYSLFVPEQLPTLLSFIYTNIPPIRKGIDSRVGFGFRLGPNADVQVMLELGPQQNTAPVGPQKADGNSKRETRLPPYKYRAPVKGSWLQAWRQQQTYIDDGEDVGVMPAQPAMDRDVIAHLQQLYKEQPMTDSDRTGKELKARGEPVKHKPTPNQQGQDLTNTEADTETQQPNRITDGVIEEAATPIFDNERSNNVPT